MHGLYPIADLDTLSFRGVAALEFARAVLKARPAFLQLRAKRSSPRETVGLLRALLPLCREAGTWLFANDRPDLAIAAGADGVHVGQEDLSVADVRRLSPSLKVGVSTHSPDQLEAALLDRPDYVAYGPVFETRSKERPEASVGLDGLRWASERAHAANTPLVAIGGINVERAPAVGAMGAMGAVIANLFPEGPLPTDPATLGQRISCRAMELHRLLAMER